MRTSNKRFYDDELRINSELFAEVCRNGNENVFVRNRKMPWNDLAYTLIYRKGITLNMELRGYMDISHPGVQISKAGYLKQRYKLNPAAFIDLYQFHNRNFYSDPDTERYTINGFLILAADGSDINIPTTPETLARYGNATRSENEKPCAQLGLGCLYDTLNRMILDASINRYKFDEMGVAEAQIARVRDTIGQHPFLVTMDRGYSSTPAFLRMIDSNTYFVARLKSSDYKAEQKAMTSDDEDVEIVLTANRRNNHIGTANESIMNSREKFTLRMVRVWLDEDHTNSEILATNIPRDKFPADKFGEIYHLRWRIETAFQMLKDRLKLECFTGTKPILIEQDIYSTIYVCNLAEDIARDVEHEQKDHLQNDYKHRMAINRTSCIHLLKNDLIYILLEKDRKKKNALFLRLYEDISKNIVPVRPGRSYKRTKGVLAGKYSNTHKPAY